MKLRLFKTASASQTRKLAKLLATKIKRPRRLSKNALIIGLTGDLGSGKTTFIQGFANGLNIKNRLISPTFLIIRSYQLKTKNYKLFYHVDCYRLKKPVEIIALGFKKIIADPENIILIEWADKIRKILPRHTIWLKFRHGQKEHQRIIETHEESFTY